MDAPNPRPLTLSVKPRVARNDEMEHQGAGHGCPLSAAFACAERSRTLHFPITILTIITIPTIAAITMLAIAAIAEADIASIVVITMARHGADLRKRKPAHVFGYARGFPTDGPLLLLPGNVPRPSRAVHSNKAAVPEPEKLAGPPHPPEQR
jgi:hypothetical protein